MGFSYVDFLLSLQRSVLRRPKGQVVGQVTPGALYTNRITHSFSPKDGGPPGRTKWLIGVSLMVKRKPGTRLLLGMSKHPLPHSRQVSKRVVLNGKTTLLDHALGISGRWNSTWTPTLTLAPPRVIPQPRFR